MAHLPQQRLPVLPELSTPTGMVLAKVRLEMRNNGKKKKTNRQ
jgi:hypothetical protein